MFANHQTKKHNDKYSTTKATSTAVAHKPSALNVMAARLSVDPAKLLDTLKATVFAKATIGGNKFWLSSWLKVSKKTGRKFLSIAFKPADAPPPESQEILPTQTDYPDVPF